MSKQTNEAPASITLTDERGDIRVNGDGNPLIPNNIPVGATIKFTTIRNDGTRVTSTRFVVDGDSKHLTLKAYTGEITGTLNVTQYTRECFTYWEDSFDAMHDEDDCRGTLTFDGLEYINNRGVNFGQALNIEVTNP